MLTLDQFKEARSVLQGTILPTKLIYSPALTKATGNNVYLKPENMQVTGAYKIRGACYKISTLSEEQKARQDEIRQQQRDQLATDIAASKRGSRPPSSCPPPLPW